MGTRGEGCAVCHWQNAVRCLLALGASRRQTSKYSSEMETWAQRKELKEWEWRSLRFGEGFFFFDIEYRQCLIAKILTEAVGRCPVVGLPVAGGLHPDCFTFTSFLASILHHGPEIKTAILEHIQQQLLRIPALGSPESLLVLRQG